MEYMYSDSDSTVQKKLHGISGTTLKFIGIFFMLLDFIGIYILESHVFDVSKLEQNGAANGFTSYELADLILRLLGGIAFPIFCFLLVEGFVHTSNIKKYILRLLLTAIITEVIWDIANGNGWFFLNSQNVLFTLLIGLLVLTFIRRFSGRLILQSVAFFAGVILCSVINSDFGGFGYGVILITFMYATREKKLFFNIFGPLLTIAASIFNGYLLALLAFIPINLYNGRRSPSKWSYAFYAVYPALLLTLHLAGLLFF